MPRVLIAEKHSQPYLIHKYWSRKPANVVQALLERYTRPGDLVLDPFCGSGVALIEAAKLGRNSIGVDLNPAAALLSRVSTRRHDLSLVTRAWHGLLDTWKAICQQAYRSESGREVKHCVHTPLILCPLCQAAVRADCCRKVGSRYACPQCGQWLNTSMAHAAGTIVTAVQFASGDLVTEQRVVEDQAQASQRWHCSPAVCSRFDIPLLPNSRILAHRGMTTATLFTPRNFSLLSRLAQLVHDAEFAEAIKDVLLLIVTSAVASCSRLMAFRNNMQGGGPAWTVPGFWVPPLHLERNPLPHLTARFQKVERGLTELAGQLKSSGAEVYLDDSSRRLERWQGSALRVNYIFADPPYGDSVPFLEFSQIWNCWAASGRPAFEREVVVSDRAEAASCWPEYQQRLAEIFRGCRRILAEDGHLTVTFNNLDVRAWHALLRGIQQARFQCVDVVYQLPAVISAKAGFAPKSSCLGDIYATFQKAPAGMRYRCWSAVKHRLAEARRLRGGAVSRVTQIKVAALSILEQNVDARCLSQLDGQLTGLPAKTPAIPADAPLFHAIQEAVAAELAEGLHSGDAELCAAVVTRLPLWLGLDQYEILDVADRAGLAKKCRGIAGRRRAGHDGQVAG